MGNPLESLSISCGLQHLVISDIEGFLKIFSIPKLQQEKPQIPKIAAIEKLKMKEERRSSNLAMMENNKSLFLGGQQDQEMESVMVHDGKGGVVEDLTSNVSMSHFSGENTGRVDKNSGL